MPERRLASRIRWGILGLPLSGVLYLQSLSIAGEFVDPRVDSRGFAQWVTSARFQWSLLVDALSTTLVLVRVVALYAYLATGRAERWALAGQGLFVASIGGQLSMGSGIVSAMPAAEMYLQGEQDALDAVVLATDPANAPALLFAGGTLFAAVLPVLSNVLIGIAIWRSGTLPQGAAVLWIGAAVLSVAVLNPWYDLGGWVQALLTALDLGGSGWIAFAVW